MATTHIDYRKIDYDQLLDKPIIRTDASVDTLTTAGVYDKWDGKRYIVSVNGQNITQVIEEKDWYQTRSSTDGGTTWGAWETVEFSKSGDIDAEDVNYDNTTSELQATNVQAAIDEIDTSVDDVKGDITDIQGDITNIQWDITNIQGDITEIKNIIEVETMPTPSEDAEGTIIQYKGATTSTFTHWYFYECVSDGQTPATYSWERIDVQPAWAWDEHEFITQTAYDALTPAQKAAKVYMIKEEWVPGSWLTAWAGIDITNNVISADMTTAVYDNTTSGATATNIQDAIDEVFQSVSNGKTLIAAAITDKGVSTAASDSFQTMAENIERIDTNQVLNSSNGAFINEAYYSWSDWAVNFATFGINDFNGGIGSIAWNNHSSWYTSCVIAITDSNWTVTHSEQNINISSWTTVKSYIYNWDNTNVYFYCWPSIWDWTLFCMINTTTKSISFNPTTPTWTREQITTTSTNVSYKIWNREIDAPYCRDIILLLQKF